MDGSLKVDGGIPNKLDRAVEAATALEQHGYDGGWTAETSHDSFLPLVLAADLHAGATCTPS